MKKMASERKINYVYLVVLAGDILAMVNDTTSTWSSSAIPKLLSNDTQINPLGKPINSDQETWIGSCMNMGTIFGALPFGFLADLFGRKYVLIFLAVPHLVAFLIFAFAKSIYLFYFGRVLNGISYTGTYILLPMYIAEISEDQYRGILLVSYGISATFGDLFSYIVGAFLSIKTFNLILSIFPLSFMILFGLIAPESPYFLVGRNDQKAELNLIKLRSTVMVLEELEQIKTEKIKNKPNRKEILQTLKKRYTIKGFLISMFLFLFLQLSGMSPILEYTQLIFDYSGVNLASDIAAILVGCALFLATIVSVFVVDKKGRRPLLLWSAFGMFASHLLFGLYLFLNNSIKLSNLGWMSLVCLIMYVWFFSTGFGPLCLTVSSEILPSNVKFLLITIVWCCHTSTAFMLAKFFNDMIRTLSIAGTFWFYGGCSFLAYFFVILFVPETKGRSFNDIQDILNK